LIAPVRNQLVLLELRREEQLPRMFAKRLQKLRERYEYLLLTMRQQVHFLRSTRASVIVPDSRRAAGAERTPQGEIGFQEISEILGQQNKEQQQLKAHHEQQRQQLAGTGSGQQQQQHYADRMFALQQQLILEIVGQQGNWTEEQQLQLAQHAVDDQHQQRAGTPPGAAPQVQAAAAVRDQDPPPPPPQQQQQWEQPPSQQQVQELVRELDVYDRQLFKFEKKLERKIVKQNERMEENCFRVHEAYAGVSFRLPALCHEGSVLCSSVCTSCHQHLLGGGVTRNPPVQVDTFTTKFWCLLQQGLSKWLAEAATSKCVTIPCLDFDTVLSAGHTHIAPKSVGPLCGPFVFGTPSRLLKHMGEVVSCGHVCSQ
jgi:hypothetical protein